MSRAKVRREIRGSCPTRRTINLRAFVVARILIFALLVTMLIYLVAVFHPYSQSLEHTSTLPISALHGWILLQAFLLTVPGLLAGYFASLRWPRLGWAVGAMLIVVGGLLFCFDVLAFNAFGERLLSETSFHVLWVLAPGLAANLNGSMLSTAGMGIVAALSLLVGAASLAGYLARRVIDAENASSKVQLVTLACSLMLALAAMPLLRPHTTLAEMRTASDRNPICATGLIGHVDRGIPPPQGADALRSAVRALGTHQRITDLELYYPQLTAEPARDGSADVLLVVVESLRHEAITQSTTPNIHALADNGIWARNHFSTSNATNMGMFSAFYGLESVWFERGRHWRPAIIELFKQAGYEIGFFGGSEDWDTFQMETFVNSTLFDEFHTCPVRWVDSDREMVERADHFLEADRDERGHHSPRLAILYIYSTHFDYRSESQDQIYQPAAVGELSAAFGPATRDLIWNRYLNSVRFVDRLLSPLLTSDRVIAIIGDHGEAFLEDGSRLHGTKISHYQNATPAIIAGPAVTPMQIDAVTSHIDILPTLLHAAGVHVKGRSMLEGHDLMDAPIPTDRLIATRNYLRPEIAILGSWTGKHGMPFGYRAFFSLEAWQAFPGNPIDKFGYELPRIATKDACDGATSAASETERVFGRWLAQRFNPALASPSEDVIGDLVERLHCSRKDVAIKALQLAAVAPASTASRLLPAVAELARSSDNDIRRSASAALIQLQRRLK